MKLFQHPWWFTGLIIGLVLLGVVDVLDTVGAESVDAAFKRALLGFALARGLNGVISVAQGTEFSVAPAGVGVNLSPGEILDPINDLVERFSWIMLLASSALGAQKVLLSVSGWYGFSVLLVLCGALLIALKWLPGRVTFMSVQQAVPLSRILSQVFVIVLLLRFAMPLVALGNEWAYQNFLSQQYTEASSGLSTAQSEISDINAVTTDAVLSDNQSDSEEDKPSFMDRARAMVNVARNQVDLNQRLEDYRVAAQSVSENAISLIVVFMLQTVIFPLLFLWVIYRLCCRLFRRLD